MPAGMTSETTCRLISGKGHPAERPLADAEKRPNVGGDETGIFETARLAALTGEFAKVIAVIENMTAPFLEGEHQSYMAGHGLEGPFPVGGGIRLPQSFTGCSTRPGPNSGGSSSIITSCRTAPSTAPARRACLSIFSSITEPAKSWPSTTD